MTLNLDTFIEIGDQHKVCEDYIIMGNDPVPFIVLSDGCSKARVTLTANIPSLLSLKVTGSSKADNSDILSITLRSFFA